MNELLPAGQPFQKEYRDIFFKIRVDFENKCKFSRGERVSGRVGTLVCQMFLTLQTPVRFSIEEEKFEFIQNLIINAASIFDQKGEIRPIILWLWTMQKHPYTTSYF